MIIKVGDLVRYNDNLTSTLGVIKQIHPKYSFFSIEWIEDSLHDPNEIQDPETWEINDFGKFSGYSLEHLG